MNVDPESLRDEDVERFRRATVEVLSFIEDTRQVHLPILNLAARCHLAEVERIYWKSIADQAGPQPGDELASRKIANLRRELRQALDEARTLKARVEALQAGFELASSKRSDELNAEQAPQSPRNKQERGGPDRASALPNGHKPAGARGQP